MFATIIQSNQSIFYKIVIYNVCYITMIETISLYINIFYNKNYSIILHAHIFNYFILHEEINFHISKKIYKCSLLTNALLLSIRKTNCLVCISKTLIENLVLNFSLNERIFYQLNMLRLINYKRNIC